MSHLTPNEDGAIELTADRRLFSRAMVKSAAAIVADRCHVLLDLTEDGDVRVSLRAVAGEESGLREAAGLFGNLLISALVNGKMDRHAQAARNLLLARALDGALPLADAPEAAGPRTTEDTHGR